MDRMDHTGNGLGSMACLNEGILLFIKYPVNITEKHDMDRMDHTGNGLGSMACLNEGTLIIYKISSEYNRET
ncbi:hypothetical protein GDO86_020027 [Hymenochirus boettgeri]|nr:hypothetical protein GDO86_020027 [Hymenochirus boettgeri]